MDDGVIGGRAVPVLPDRPLALMVRSARRKASTSRRNATPLLGDAGCTWEEAGDGRGSVAVTGSVSGTGSVPVPVTGSVAVTASGRKIVLKDQG